MAGYRNLEKVEIQTLEAGGCSAEIWAQVKVADGFDASRVHNVVFQGEVRIGALAGMVSLNGVELPSGIADATFVSCDLGDNVRVTSVKGYIANYSIGAGAVVCDIGEMVTRPGATFGNGVEIEAVNEGGGRGIRMFNELSSQFAYLTAMHRYRTDVVEKLDAMVDACVAEVTSDVGTVGEGAVVAHVPEIVDVNIGAHATVTGAASLKNGTVLSEQGAPTTVGSGVTAEDFIVGEGSTVDGGAVLSHTFVGQGVQMGKQFSAENSLFFANSECFHGEACSVFGGPYTVTHHKSTLLIAGLFSFYNAGSGSNQSNHMYKLGPVHQGLLERGSKTGSSSYLLWASAVGPFSVVIGKHFTNFDIRDLPFSYLTEEEGASMLTPSMNLYTVGTVRDGEKWPSRDRRKSSVKRDQIRFEVFSPYTIGRMIAGEALLTLLYKETARDVETVRHKGVTIKRLVLRYGARNYATAIDLYLNGKIVERLGRAPDVGLDAVRDVLADPCDAVHSESWADVGGLLISGDRLKALEDNIVSGKAMSAGDVLVSIEAASECYPTDEWAWVRRAYENRTGRPVDDLSLEDLEGVRAAYIKGRSSFINRVLADAKIEFDEAAKLGYGVDGGPDEAVADFEEVRGDYESNSFVMQMRAELDRIQKEGG